MELLSTSTMDAVSASRRLFIAMEHSPAKFYAKQPQELPFYL